MSQEKLEHDHRSVGPWVWLLPAAYAIHIVEEAFGGGGIMGYMSAGGGMSFSLAQFAGANLIVAVILCLAAWSARRWEIFRWSIVAGAAVLLSNAAGHAAVSAATRSYVAGLWTGLVLFVSVGVFLLIRMWHLVSRRVYAVAIVAGIVLHWAVIWVAFRLPNFRPR